MILHDIKMLEMCIYHAYISIFVAIFHHIQPQAPQERSDVGVLTLLEIEVSNVGSSTLDNIKLQIYYPAASSGTGEYFFLLPECAVTKVWTIIRESSL